MSIYDLYRNHSTLEVALFLENTQEPLRDIYILASRTDHNLPPDLVRDYITSDPALKFGNAWSSADDFDLSEVDWALLADSFNSQSKEADQERVNQNSLKYAHLELSKLPGNDALGVPNPAVRKVFETLRVDRTEAGFIVQMPDNLPRDIYGQVSAALKCVGVNWIKSKKVHLGKDDPTEKIADLVQYGAPRFKKPYDYGFFATPRDLAVETIKRANLKPGMRVLEPGIGSGGLADVIKELHPDVTIVAFEISPERHGAILDRHPGTQLGDFLEVTPTGDFDAVIMNPPFEKGQDVTHINHAMKFLKPGGVMSAIASASVNFNSRALYESFRGDVVACGGEIFEHPEDSFKQSGTLVRTVGIVITKPPNSPSNFHSAVARSEEPEVAPVAVAAAEPEPTAQAAPTLQRKAFPSPLSRRRAPSPF